ncbi:cysteine--1-D-myo-inosityl 2-amino-2-deoxy-alpha-D-glucopyranoside ligase [Corynebacterium pygosceleis]|uniref:cysteine--1-D-myo-inosityl 2-amino-2-deoxy-alpha-D-glucopyranoside ligase n=1 Tax=Corynebacterium pygosceleis TaxID=2800406 RepID=UPI0019085B75|nr:cysteine--1-D-myo-inosityl 2-amino-2-deoxy-alpha-D-glucopyranoside ligase [Corynebacterium pygosceleis]MCL0120187.1 cysteine--1-D-myo-inosityl 2-amino-2-deoxy-alpha-D-glucopyranoside ligase [Corynebacterium pygosceleis]
MHSWPHPEVPVIDGPPVPLTLFDTADGTVRPVTVSGGTAGMYVCGITPYDSTHLGHAATYLTFDLINRQLRDNGYTVRYVQNVTDVDDPLFERATRDNVDWRELGRDQTDLFRSDMTALRVLPPTDFIAVTDIVDEVIDLVSVLLDNGSAYIVDDGYPDIYASLDATPVFGYESNYDRQTMMRFFAERGGDPDRPGKRDPLDALVWRAARPGEPTWEAPFGSGRPGWHIECAAIAVNRLGAGFAVQGGGTDLIFPHHEYSAAHVEAATGSPRMAGHYVHSGMIGLDGTKMSKSLGNLVFVHKLTAAGHEPEAIRLGVFASGYRDDRDWSEKVLAEAERRLALWRRAAETASDTGAATELVQRVRAALADDLDTPGALAAVDAWATSVDGTPGEGRSATEAGRLVSRALDALMGVPLLPRDQGTPGGRPTGRR